MPSKPKRKPSKRNKRKPRDQTFRKTDVVRAYRAAVAAEMKNPRIIIDTATKQITIEPATPRDDDQKNEWDEVCTATGDEATR
jgi:hypothetical protein